MRLCKRKPAFDGMIKIYGPRLLLRLVEYSGQILQRLPGSADSRVHGFDLLQGPGVVFEHFGMGTDEIPCSQNRRQGVAQVVYDTPDHLLR